MAKGRWIVPLALALVASVVLTASAAPAAPGNGVVVVESQGRLYAVDPGTGAEVDLGPGSAAAWSPDGSRIAFLDGGGVSVMNADGTDRARIHEGSADRRPVWSPEGSRLAFTSGAAALVVVNAAGGVEQRVVSNGVSVAWPPAWSPDGSRIAYTRASGSLDLAVVGADGSGDRVLVAGATPEAGPAWSPDGTQIAFFRSAGASPAVHVVGSDGGRVDRLAATSHHSALTGAAPPSWSPDGARIAFTGTTRLEYYPRAGQAEFTDVFVVDADGSLERRLTVPSHSFDLGNRSPVWSPDGTRIAFQSHREGGVYFMNADGTCETRLGTRASHSPAWQPLPLAGAAPRLRCADLQLTVGNKRGSVAAGGEERFDISVLNLETEPATGVRFRAAPLDGGSFVSASSAHGQCTMAGGALSCELGTLPVGESARIEVVARAERLGNIHARADVTAGEPDGNRSNNVWTLRFDALPCTLVGTANRDDLVGTPARETICALADADRIRALGGADSIDAGGGADRVYPGPGRDTVELRAGADLVDARDGERDTIACGGEHDVALVDRVDETDRNCEVVIRSKLRCSTLGTVRADELVGTDRGDSICSLAGNDTIRADKGADSVDGGGGNDTITGGPGRDLLLGGAGYDTIQARDGERDGVRCGANFDVVLADKRDAVARDCERVQRT